MLDRILFIDVDMSMKEEDKGQLISNWSHHPIGLMYLAAQCRKFFPEIEVRLFHTTTSKDPIADIQSIIKNFSPNLIGLRALSVQSDFFDEIAGHIRQDHPKIRIIAGGPYPSSSYGKLLKSSLVDLVVIGEGEETLIELITAFKSDGRIPADVAGTAVFSGSKVRLNPARLPVSDLDSIPYPDYSMISLKDYAGLSNHAFQDTSDCAFIFATRGCPYRCFYCHTIFGKKIRRRSAENIVEEMKAHRDKRGIDNFVFIDDTFNVPKDEAKRTLSLIAGELPGVKLSFPNGLRADQLDHELVDLLEAAGTNQLSLAVETASPRLQKMIGKNLNIEKAKEFIELTSKRFVVGAFFMIGFPTETVEEAEATVELAKELNYLVQPLLSIVRIYEGTSLYKMLEPDKAQRAGLRRQAQGMYQPKLTEPVEFYGDLFPVDKVPLRSAQIQKIRMNWFFKIFMNKRRIKNSHAILERHFNKDQVLQYYRNLYDNPRFSDSDMSKLLI